MSGGATNGRVVLFEAANGREECSISTRGVQYPLHYTAADELTLHCTHHAVSTALRGGSGRRAHVHARVGAAQEARETLTPTAARCACVCASVCQSRSSRDAYTTSSKVRDAYTNRSKVPNADVSYKSTCFTATSRAKVLALLLPKYKCLLTFLWVVQV